ncbi:class I SAM-dependent methyltransferase [Mucilaginibacter sp. SP1R1]|uniref:class I SAM-dependent methyltransferase n=1 Tax=Mucilaginibacter sp. SP1R1 TaxID=2723091 RepID=UPI001616C461|nr:class I SAM-dependent methyltransferase [Mucilaginibacter sp. SP1R1]MBB6150338.1 ubiquinone/menaquinone biosynthesis C-methylase UbiE [Mucilaginibacter sp. SP1R1]
MGSKSIQGQLWGKRALDWAAIQEPTGKAGYTYVINLLQPTPADHILDVGCGSGLFSDLASKPGAHVTGIDASEVLLDEARQRNPSITFLNGEMEELPFDDQSFTLVCGFNSFQYAANVKNALSEAKRVLKTGGKLALMIWGNKEDCEAATYLKAIGNLLPPPPPGAPGPFALTENRLLENVLEDIGLKIINSADVDSIWDYENREIALKGLLSAGPAAKAIDHSGFEKVQETILAAIQPYIKPNGHVVYQNKFRIVIAEK